MSESNKALCRRVYEEMWNQRNPDVIEQVFAANFTDHDPASPDYGRGPEAARKKHNQYSTAFPDTKFTIEDTIAEGDRVVVRWTARGTHRGELRGIPPSGKSVTVNGTTTFRVNNGKIVEAYDHWDALGLMQQLGVGPKQAGRATA